MAQESFSETHTELPALPAELAEYMSAFLQSERERYVVRKDDTGVAFVDRLIAESATGDTNTIASVAGQLELHYAHLDKAEDREQVREMGNRAKELRAWLTGVCSAEGRCLPTLPQELNNFLLGYFRKKS